MAQSNSIRNQPQNGNLTQTTQYMLNFFKIPDTNYFCQTLTLPGVNLGEAIQTTPFTDIYRPGDKLQYDPLTVTFLVDEKLRAWKNIHDWMRGLAYPTKFREYEKQKAEGLVSDATVSILSGLNNPIVRIVFRDVWPISLSPLNYSSSDDGGISITADATFRYTYFDIIPVQQ